MNGLNIELKRKTLIVGNQYKRLKEWKTFIERKIDEIIAAKWHKE